MDGKDGKDGKIMPYRRRRDTGIWHWCPNCSNWPTGREGVDYFEQEVKPAVSELDAECVAKEAAGNCVADEESAAAE